MEAPMSPPEWERRFDRGMKDKEYLWKKKKLIFDFFFPPLFYSITQELKITKSSIFFLLFSIPSLFFPKNWTGMLTCFGSLEFSLGKYSHVH